MTYRVEKQYEGRYYVLDDEGDRVASVGRFMPGPMVSVTGPQIMPPAMARAVAEAMRRLADDLDPEARGSHLEHEFTQYFRSTADRDAFIDREFPERTAAERIPGLYRLPDGRWLSVLCTTVTVRGPRS